MLEFLLAVVAFGLMLTVVAFGLSRSERAVHKFDSDRRDRDKRKSAAREMDHPGPPPGTLP